MDTEQMVEELIRILLKRQIKFPLIISLLIIAVMFFTIFTCIDLATNDDSFSSKSTLYNENVQFEIRKNEAKFRDEIFTKLKSLYLDKKFNLIDSISKDQKENNDIKNYIIVNKLKNLKENYTFYTKIDKTTTPLVDLKGITTKFEIDFNKLNKILDASRSRGLIEENIKYGNFLKTFYEFDKKVKIDYIIIVSLIIIAILIILYFTNRISSKNKKDKIEEAVDNLDTDKQNLKKAELILNNKKKTEKEINMLKKIVYKLQQNLDSYKFDNILKSILYEDVIKSERKSLELYNRSTLMLILGLLVAIAGIFVFYFTLPEFGDIKKYNEYLALTIRPTLILIFIQSISFYLLKQYRSLINDYKYFHNEYLKKSRVFIVYQLMQNDKISDLEMKLIDNLLVSESTGIKIEEEKNIDDEKLLDIFKTLLNKLK